VNGETALWPSLVCGALVAAASILIGTSRGDLDVDVALASMATFLFGVMIAFTIARTRDRLSQVQDLLSRGNASLLSLYEMVEVFSLEDRSRIRGLIDNQLCNQIDHKLVDNHLSTPSHQALVAAVFALDPQTTQQVQVYRVMVETCVEMGTNRLLIETVTGQSLSPIEWTGMLLLLFLLVALFAVIPGGTVLGALVAGVLAGTLVTLMVLLRKLDLLRWHERVSIWEPAARLFRSMKQHPYVPREVIDSGRYHPTGVIRIVDYPDPYPERSTKIVTVAEVGGDGGLIRVPQPAE
jgi:hypothetical protein